MTFTVPGYKLERQLGHGSQGEVWLAERTGTGERVALKRFALDSPKAAEVARTEAGLLATLDHPSLIGLREFHSCPDGFVLVLELAEAGSLANLLHRRGKLTPAEVVATVSPVAAALAHAHNAGVLHGDVSPANILFSVTGHPKLADLGVARLVAGIGAGSGLGTPAYLDPVIAAGGAPGLPSDVFSLAAVTLHALTGAGPWSGPGQDPPSAEQVLGMAATGQVIDLERRLAAVPPAMAGALTRALDRNPIRRGTAAEFALDMRAALPPSPVVLAGGRITGSVGRHAAEHRSQSLPAGRGPEPVPFLAPDGSGPEFVPADLTRVSRPLIRSLPPPEPAAGSAGRTRRIFNHMLGGSSARAAAVLGLVAVLAVAGVLGWPLLRHRAASAGAETRPAITRPASTARSSTASASSSVSTAPEPPASKSPGPPTSVAPTSAAPSSAAPSSAAAAVAVLVRLDSLRAQAYAQRRPDLLGQVYGSSSLLAADTATLTRLVPPGCTLTGLHTGYRDARLVQPGRSGFVVRVIASLPAGSLRCPDAAATTSVPLGPRPLVIGLSASGGEFRIVSQANG